MTEPTKKLTPKEKFDELYKSLEEQLNESSQNKIKEYFKLVALSDKPVQDSEDFCPNQYGMAVRSQLETVELYEKYVELTKACEDSANESKEGSDEGKDQAGAREALEKFILEDLMGNPYFAEQFEDQLDAIETAEGIVKKRVDEVQADIKKLQEQLDKSEDKGNKDKLEAQINKLNELPIDKKEVDQAKKGLFDAVKRFPKPKFIFGSIDDHIKNADQYNERFKWERSAARDNISAFRGKDASRLRDEIKELGAFIVKLEASEAENPGEEDLKKLQELKEEINSSLFAKAEDKDSAPKEKATKPSFSASVKSGFETAMNYLKKNQNTLRNIAGGLLATVFIYNIVAGIAGFNAFALMASIATLTSTLPLVLASAEIALIAFAGTSLIAYTATSDRVRKACSLADLKEPSTKPSEVSPEAGNDTGHTPG